MWYKNDREVVAANISPLPYPSTALTTVGESGAFDDETCDEMLQLRESLRRSASAGLSEPAKIYVSTA
jgi:hypothetical protein